MIRLLLLCCWLVCPFTWGFSQESLDALWQTWQNEAQEDSARLQALDDYTWYSTRGYQQFEEVLRLADIQYEFAETHDLPKWKAKALNAKGIAHAQQGKNREALPFFERSLELEELTSNTKGVAASLNNIGNIYNELAKYADAKLYFQRALTLHQELQNNKQIASTLTNLGNVSFRLGDFDEALAYYEESLTLQGSVKDPATIAGTLNNIGGIYKSRGTYVEALGYYTNSLALGKEKEDAVIIVRALDNLANLYKLQGDTAQALSHYQEGLGLLREGGLQGGIPHILNGIGTIYREQGKMESAARSYQEALEMAQASGRATDVALSLNNLGLLYEAEHDLVKAHIFLIQALQIQDSIGNKAGSALSLSEIGRIYVQEGKFGQARAYSERALAIGEELNLPEPQITAANSLYNIYRKNGNESQALAMLERYYELRDRLINEENQQALLEEKYRNEYEKQELKIRSQEIYLSRQRIALAAAALGLILILGLAYAIYQGKRRSDRLLWNILPVETAKELRARGKVEAKEFDNVSILVSDFKDFTQISAGLNAKDLVAEIDYCFKGFDQIITHYGLEKIKTVGDAYLAASGLPDPTNGSVIAIVQAALDMQAFIEARKAVQVAKGLPFFEMRLGIHTGPVVAGVVGVKKFQYDVWGDTVNTASRMETAGEVSKVNVSASTFAQIKNYLGFVFVSRGAVDVKGKGSMEMYFVEKASA